MRWLRAPVLHFFAIGALLFVVDRETRAGLPPLVEESPALLGADALLVREARARGYQRSDSLVRRRLVRNMRFVSGNSERSDESLFEEALALGMDRSDPVVQRRLAQLMSLGIEAAARLEAPSEEELEAYLARHAERFGEPPRIRLSHVFLSRDRRGAAVSGDARALLARVVAEQIPPERAAELGDPLLLAPHQPSRSEPEIARTFGGDFAARVAEAEPGEWFGPVASSYGVHLVWVHEHRPAHPPSLEAVRGAVREALLADRAELALGDALRALRSG